MRRTDTVSHTSWTGAGVGFSAACRQCDCSNQLRGRFQNRVLAIPSSVIVKDSDSHFSQPMSFWTPRADASPRPSASMLRAEALCRVCGDRASGKAAIATMNDCVKAIFAKYPIRVSEGLSERCACMTGMLLCLMKRIFSFYAV